MSRADEDRPDTTGAVPLRVARAARIDVEAARLALAELAWLGPTIDGPESRPSVRRIAADLELPIRDGSGTNAVRKAALIDVGEPQMSGDALVASVEWRSATLAPLFPVFAGELRVTAKGLTLRGGYAPPFGSLGLAMDAALLRFVARRTAQAFLARVAERVSG